MRRFNKIFTVVVLLFLYIPMIVLAVGSFNSGMDIAVFKDFTLDNYRELFSDGVLLPLLLNSVIVAVIASVIATVLGTAAAIGINSMSPKLRKLSMSITNIPMTNPEIVTGVSLALLFAFVGTLLKINNILGFATLLIAHVTFCLPYVILSVMPKLHQMDPNLNEAAQDLGASGLYTFFHVTLPVIMPGIVAGGLLAFTLSIDDVVITSFVNGAGTNTFPTFVSSMTKHSRNLPAVFALSTLMLIFTCVLVGISKLLTGKTQNKTSKGKK